MIHHTMPRQSSAPSSVRLPQLCWPLLGWILLISLPQSVVGLEPIPDKLVVLTFDDSVKSHFTVVRPILKKHGFRATFFITEGFDFKTNKKDYMTWEQIALLHKDGFEIGNHTRDHLGVTAKTLDQVDEQLTAINQQCRKHGIPQTVSFAFPGNAIDRGSLPILKKLGIKFARRGGAPEYPYKQGNGFAYEPGLDHPLLIPSAGDARPSWTIDNFRRAVEQARHGRISVLQFHGVPDNAHPWVHTPQEKFEHFMRFLSENDYRVIALQDLDKYVDSTITPKNPDGVIEDRKSALAAGRSLDNFRKPKDDKSLQRWLENMVWHHRFTTAEVSAATGMTADQIVAALKRFDIRKDNRPVRKPDAPLLTLPYPGGPSPRIGFLDGMIRPQRETKCSVFTPWDSKSFVVLDVPEALWHNKADGKGRELLYLAHTHIPTRWDRQSTQLEKLEWQHLPRGVIRMERRLPNGVTFGTQVTPGQKSVHMEMWLTNGSDEMLSGLRVQNCVMLKGAPEFSQLTNDNKTISEPYVACRSSLAKRWVITAWSPTQRAWANTDCPCMHSDPQFPDCPPGETRRLRGWLSFYQGNDLAAELRRIDATGWQKD